MISKYSLCVAFLFSIMAACSAEVEVGTSLFIGKGAIECAGKVEWVACNSKYVIAKEYNEKLELYEFSVYDPSDRSLKWTRKEHISGAFARVAISEEMLFLDVLCLDRKNSRIWAYDIDRKSVV